MKACFKTILFSSLSTIVAFFAITYTSCSPDKCKAIVCAYGGVCNNGSCTCASGYEGTQCETVSRVKFIGNWTTFEKGSTTNSGQYTVVVSEGQNVSDLALNNFNNYFTTPVYAYVAVDSIYIPSQTIQNKTIIGVGYISQGPGVNYDQFDEITLKYKVVDQTTGVEDDYGYDAADLSQPSLWNKQ